MMTLSPKLSIIVPCYCEEETLPSTAEILNNLLQQMIDAGEIHEDSHCCFVNDGSHDDTWNVIINLSTKSNRFQGINLSRNFGHQNAVLAGLFTDNADVYVSIDADLQDDEQKIRDMVQLYREGKDIVYGCRNDRSTDSWFKRNTAKAFYHLRAALGCHTIPDHADFRLMSARAVHELRAFIKLDLFNWT